MTALRRKLAAAAIALSAVFSSAASADDATDPARHAPQKIIAATVLGELGTSSKTADEQRTIINALTPLLRDTDAQVRLESVNAIGAIVIKGDAVISGGNAAVVTNLLGRMTKDSDAAVRKAVAKNIGEIGKLHRSQSAPALKALGTMTADRDGATRESVLSWISIIGNTHATAAATALRQLNAIQARPGEIQPLRRLAIQGIAQIGELHRGHASAAITALTPLTRDPDADLRYPAMQGIALIALAHPPFAQTGLNAINLLRNDPDQTVREGTERYINEIKTLYKMNPPPSAPAP